MVGQGSEFAAAAAALGGPGKCAARAGGFAQSTAGTDDGPVVGVGVAVEAVPILSGRRLPVVAVAIGPLGMGVLDATVVADPDLDADGVPAGELEIAVEIGCVGPAGPAVAVAVPVDGVEGPVIALSAPIG